MTPPVCNSAETTNSDEKWEVGERTYDGHDEPRPYKHGQCLVELRTDITRCLICVRSDDSAAWEL